VQILREIVGKRPNLDPDILLNALQSPIYFVTLRTNFM